MDSARGLAAVVLGAVVTLGVAGCEGSRASTETEFALVAVLRVGQAEGPPEYALGNIWSVLPAADGGFYTCDSNDLVLRRYDAAGEFLHTIGRKGQGPGEYGHCMDAILLGDSMVVVSDPGNGRFVFFRTDGTFDRVLGLRIYPGFGGGDNMFLADEQGRLWKRGARIGGERPVEGEGEFGRTQFVIIDPASGPVDSVLVPGGSGSSIGRGFALSTNDGMYQLAPPDTLWAVATDGAFIVAGRDEYRVMIRSGTGAERQLVREATPLPYEPEERAEWTAWRDYFASRSPQFPPAPVPAHKPLLRSLRVDDAGRIWVQVHVRAEPRQIPPRPEGDLRPLLTWRERNTYDLFDRADGAFLGRLALPYATRLLASRGDRLWLAEEGESGEQVIGVYDLKSVPIRR